MLPAEIIDHIIDFLWDDYPALSKCGQVAKSWLPAARLHLLHTIIIRPSRSRGFASPLTRKSAPYFTPYVRNFEINCSPLTTDEILPFIPKFFGLQKLTLLHGYWHELPLSLRGWIKSMIVRIKYLELSQMDFKHLEQFQRIIGAAESLQTLVLNGGSLLVYGPTFDGPRTPPPRLNILVIKDMKSWELDSIRPVIIWLTSECATLHTLKIYNLHGIGRPWYSSVLRQMGPKLEHITIGNHYFGCLNGSTFNRKF